MPLEKLHRMGEKVSTCKGKLSSSRLAPRASRLSVYLAIVTLMAILGVSANISPAHAAPATKCTFAAYSLNTGGGGACMNNSFVQSARKKAVLAQKQALANEYAAVRAGKFSARQYQADLQAFMTKYGGPTHASAVAVDNIPHGVILPNCVLDPTTGQCATGYKLVNLVQQTQTQTYYCGPATASEVVGVRGVSKSQNTLTSTSYLHTDQNGGTNFGYMAPTLNALTNSSFYAAVPGSADGMNGSTITAAIWENDLVADINQGWALAANPVELGTDTVRLDNHPSNLNVSPYNGSIYHWVGVYGYESNGATTFYADSIAGTKYWAFSASVTPYNSIPDSTLATMLNRRGFIW